MLDFCLVVSVPISTERSNEWVVLCKELYLRRSWQAFGLWWEYILGSRALETLRSSERIYIRLWGDHVSTGGTVFENKGWYKMTFDLSMTPQKLFSYVADWKKKPTKQETSFLKNRLSWKDSCLNSVESGTRESSSWDISTAVWISNISQKSSGSTMNATIPQSQRSTCQDIHLFCSWRLNGLLIGFFWCHHMKVREWALFSLPVWTIHCTTETHLWPGLSLIARSRLCL